MNITFEIYEYELTLDDYFKELVDVLIDVSYYAYNVFISHIKETGISNKYILHKHIKELKKKYVNFDLLHSYTLMFISDIALADTKQGNIKDKWNKVPYLYDGYTVNKGEKYIALSKFAIIDIDFRGIPMDNGIVYLIRRDDKYFISIPSYHTHNQNIVKNELNNAVGIDIGIRKLVVDSDGHAFDFPDDNTELTDYIERVVQYYVTNYKTIYVEKLNLYKLPVRKRYKQAFKLFMDTLSIIAKNNGVNVVFVDPKYTSQICSNCGHHERILQQNKIFICSNCGIAIDRDYNAALNILKRGSDLGGDM